MLINRWASQFSCLPLMRLAICKQCNMLNKARMSTHQFITKRLVFNTTIRKPSQLSLQSIHPSILDRKEEYTNLSSITRAEIRSLQIIHVTSTQDGDSRVKKFCLVDHKVHHQSLINSFWLQHRHRSSPTITIRSPLIVKGRGIRSTCMTSKIHRIGIYRLQMLCSLLQLKACSRVCVRSR